MLEEATGLCAGCLRTAAEIGRWPFADDGEKRAILGMVEGRRRLARQGETTR